jgi:hypothetical protein
MDFTEMRKQPDNILTYLTQYMRNAQVAPVSATIAPKAPAKPRI